MLAKRIKIKKYSKEERGEGKPLLILSSLPSFLHPLLCTYARRLLALLCSPCPWPLSAFFPPPSLPYQSIPPPPPSFRSCIRSIRGAAHAMPATQVSAITELSLRGREFEVALHPLVGSGIELSVDEPNSTLREIEGEREGRRSVACPLALPCYSHSLPLLRDRVG